MAGFDLGQVEDVVDHRKQVVRRLADPVQTLALRRRGLVLAQQVGHADHRVERRADLVAHVGQELALGLAGRVGLRAGCVRLSGALGHEAFELVAVGVELVAQAPVLGHVLLHGKVALDMPPGVAQRRDHRLLDRLAAVAHAVDELAVPDFAAVERGGQRGIGLARGPARAQQGGCAPDHLGRGVAGVGQKGRVDVEDAVVQVGDQGAVRALLDRGRQFAQRVAGGLGPGAGGQRLIAQGQGLALALLQVALHLGAQRGRQCQPVLHLGELADAGSRRPLHRRVAQLVQRPLQALAAEPGAGQGGQQRGQGGQQKRLGHLLCRGQPQRAWHLQGHRPGRPLQPCPLQARALGLVPG